MLSGPAAASPAPADRAAFAGPAVNPADDAWHYRAWADGRHDATYTEWWYFNFADSRTGVRAIFSYFVSNPENILELAQVRMVAVAYTGQETVTAMDSYPAGAFSAGEGQADVTIGDETAGAGIAGAATVRVAGDGTYRIAGRSLDGRLAWDLTYSPEAAPWFAADRMQVGWLDWERMSWLVFMPRARVRGTLTVDGSPVSVNAPGYHDHNWGEWIPTDALWNWAQFSSPRLALEIGDFIGKPAGLVSLDLGGERTIFTHDQYELVHTRWGWDRVNHLFYPVASRLIADNGSRRIEVTLRALETAPLRGDLPWPLRDLIIYEQTARYEGAVWEPLASGEWRRVAWIRGIGFKEWTGRQSAILPPR